MIYIIIAQGARIVVVWAKNRTTKKVFQSIALASITFYLIKRYAYLRSKDEKR